MRNAPSVVYPVGRSAFQAWLLVFIAGLSGAVGASFLFGLDAPAQGLWGWLTCSAGVLAWAVWSAWAFLSWHPFARGCAALELNGRRGRGRRRCLVLDRAHRSGAAGVERIGACARPAGSHLAVHPWGRPGSAVDLGRTKRLPCTVERPSPSFGGELRLRALGRASAFMLTGHASPGSLSFIPWVIFPRA